MPGPRPGMTRGGRCEPSGGGQSIANESPSRPYRNGENRVGLRNRTCWVSTSPFTLAR